jgi:hypothetical protein
MTETFWTQNEFGTGEVRSWASILDDKTLEQAEMISRSPVVDGYPESVYQLQRTLMPEWPER